MPGDQSQITGSQALQPPNAVQGAPTKVNPSHGRSGLHRSKAAGGAKGNVGSRSAGNAPRNGVFVPAGGPHQSSQSSAAGSRSGKGHHAAHPNGCVFSGMSAKLNGKPAQAGFVPAGGHSLVLLLAIACGLLGFSSLSQWLRSEVRWWIS